jgi:hypothetical protein
MSTPVIAADPLAACTPLTRWVLERAAPGDEALALVHPSHSLEQLYGAWMQAKHYADAIRFTAALLPARESVWWAWVSARYAAQLQGAAVPDAKVHAALVAIEQWIVRPDDSARRAAWDAGNAAGLDSAAGMVAAAAFLSGTTVAPPDVPPVPPPPGAAYPLVVGAILVAGAAAPAEQVPATLASFAAQGLEIVKRLGGWDAAAQAAHEMSQRLAQEYARATAPPAPPAPVR